MEPRRFPRPSFINDRMVEHMGGLRYVAKQANLETEASSMRDTLVERCGVVVVTGE
jgi:hypothetical protein